MASSLKLLIFCFLILISLSKSQSSPNPKPKPKPKPLLLPVSKDLSTLQYTTQLSIGTPLVSKSFVVDLGGRYLWMTCETGYTSSTYRPGLCGSAPCSVGKGNGCFRCFSTPPRPGCTSNSTCSLAPENTVTSKWWHDELSIDTISLQTTDGTKAGQTIKIPNYIFGCSRNSLLDGLATGAKGMAGFGRSPIGISTQISSLFGGNLGRKFALCLPSDSKSKGVIFIGDIHNYTFYPHYNTSKLVNVKDRFSYTRLHINPMSTANIYIRGEPSTEYFVAVNSIMIDMKPIPINTTLLSFNNQGGIGGTKISTVHPYTVLESSIYKVVTETFAKELKARNVRKVSPSGRFSECFSTEFLSYTQMGPSVPDIQFVFENKNVYWQFSSPNLMVEISKDVVCLAFIDGGLKPRTSIVIGVHQLENNLLEFDLASSRLGFTSTLLLAEIECSNFNF